MTKILAISDIHGEENENLYTYLNNNEDIDLVIILGDITDFGPLDFVGPFIEKIAECGVDVIAIPGNCDPKGICNAINEVSFCLHNNIIAYGDAILFGYGGSNETPFNTPGEIQDNKIYGDVYELLANYDYVYNENVPKVKILVTHAPPFNTEADKLESGDHVGSQGILKSIHEFEPQINICGHIHEAKSLSKIGITTDVANPGMLKDNGAVLIDVIDGSNYDISLISLDE
ncbi:MAG: metallophosphoesterase [Methanobrevibacter sp.]|jgi:Icc-related predicted phosphoesterase|uniref:metallophosphoesterase family protein n=1 Tax=Methanobrevibacter sp. TaxID=66852 RepID=UPI0025F7DBCA|nr:metallophosphoesterase [Methanobrevibacter sp.]MBE6494786.1 metallophosphoesterase [Methanosphaera stadtmanae]MBE6497564.1 metallophosphoesterase [Methanobrevibacter sp.]